MPTKKRSVDAVVEAYLDEHPGFLEGYVRRKVSRRQLEQWLFLPDQQVPVVDKVVKSCVLRQVHASEPHLHKTGGLLACVRGQVPGHQGAGHERQRSHSFTPLRKLSASTFEAGGLATPILATTSDGQPSFLRTFNAVDRVCEAAEDEAVKEDNRTAENDPIANRKDLLLSLLPDIMQQTDLSSMVKILLKSVNLLMGQAGRVDLVILKSINSLAEGTAFLLQDDAMTRVDEISEILNSNPLMKRASERRGEVINQNNALAGAISRSENHEEIIGCLQLSEKSTGFSVEDEALFRHLLRFTSAALVQIMAQKEMRLELARSEVFLELARTVFREPTKLEATILTILTSFLSLIDCQRCQISLCDRDRPFVFKRVFDLQRQDLKGDRPLSAPFEDRLPMKSQMTGNVALTGQKVNLKDLNGDQDSDLQSFLSVPIRDPDGVVVGVISLANKDVTATVLSDNAGYFTGNDERFVEAFTVFCGMAIRNAADYERAVVSEAKLHVAFEVMNFQATSNAEETTQLANLPVPAAASISLNSFDFNYLSLDDNGTLTVCFECAKN